MGHWMRLCGNAERRASIQRNVMHFHFHRLRSLSMEISILQGNTDIEQLALVIKTLGSPRATDWPDVNSLPDFKKIQ